MGGNAFTAKLPAAKFPRLPSPLYNSLKADLIPRIQALYPHVSIPFEAPEKVDHGDIDFVVASNDGEVVPQAKVKEALGATYVNTGKGNPTSNYAVPLGKEQLPLLGEEEVQMYYQVDVHVCESRHEWEWVVFLHGYGDLGMILGLMLKRCGLAIGSRGLKLHDQPYPPFHISSSIPSILTFLGLSLDTWNAGFETREAAFKWLSASRFFNLGLPFSSMDSGRGARTHKTKRDRKMYVAFINWAVNYELATGQQSREFDNNARQAIHDETLNYFGRKEAFVEVTRGRESMQQMREAFNGPNVSEWTGCTGRELGKIMDGVKHRLQGKVGIAERLDGEGIESLKSIVLEVMHELNLRSMPS